MSRAHPRHPKEFTMKKVICGVVLSLLLAAGMTQASAANPTLAITNLTAGQALSNAAFTVRGTAKGGAGVTNVFYSLNTAGWSNAASADGWTNWSADLTLTPGTNSFAAYAQDRNGHRSMTNKVNFAYVVLTPLTVRTNGTGSIAPNYDGVALQIGKAYSMTATSPIAGFGLQSWQYWTDTNNITTNNGATLRFLMASNLTIVANLGDVTKPVISVTSVVTNSGGVPNNLLISGTAGDNVAVTNVQYSLNGSGWTNQAATGNSWSNWTALVSLAAGSNTIRLQSVDSSGNRSLTNTVKSFFTAYSTLTVRTNGPGKITPLLDGATLIIGTNYSLKATGTKTGYGLVTWTDGNSNYLGNTATLKFVMQSNLTLIANIGDVTLPTITIKGAYTNSDGIGNDYVIWGNAADNLAVSNVFYSLNNGAWMAASSTNNWKKWTANVSLVPGANTFSAYSMDGTSNKSATATMAIDYNNSAPSSLSGLACIGVFHNGTNPPAPLNLFFGKSTFSQFAQDTNAVTGVGSCFYFASGASATLRLTYTGPPSVASHAMMNFNLLFYNPKLAYFTNSAMKQSGFFYFNTTPKLVLTNVSGQLIWTVNSEGNGYGINFNKGKFVSQALATGDTNGGSYTYGTYSRNTALLKLTRTNGTSYLLTGYAGTNYGSYLEEDYDNAGNTNGTDRGIFLVDAPQDGVSPATLTNQTIDIYSPDGMFTENLGIDTFSQDTTSTNYDNDVGSFTYASVATNVGQLSLSVTEPPNLAGSNAVARLNYVGNNCGFFTNDDGSLSLFISTPANNFAYASISNAVITLNYNSGGANYFYFDALGTFSVFNGFFYQPYGTYTYQVYSPGGAMIHLNYGYNDWLQVNFKSPNSGYFYGNSFDSSTNNDVPYSGNFQIQ